MGMRLRTPSHTHHTVKPMQNTVTGTRPHTLASIAESQGRQKRAAQSWHSQAKKQHGPLGELVKGVRMFSDDERDIILGYAGPTVKTSSKVEVMKEKYPDPFDGTGLNGAMVPMDYQATDRSDAVGALTHRVATLCKTSAVNNNAFTRELLANGHQLGDQIGAALGARIIESAEHRKNAMVDEYLHSQGVTTAPKPQPA